MGSEMCIRDSDTTISNIIEETQATIDTISEENNWICKDSNGNEVDPESDEGSEICDGSELGLKMTLTGPVPLTNAITEKSFQLFWQVFPVGVVIVAFGLFLFHCDLLLTGRIRWVQGVKTLIISGLPTLCSVWITLGFIGYTNYEVTMTCLLYTSPSPRDS